MQKSRVPLQGTVIQATGTAAFEDGLRTRIVPLGGLTYPRINLKPPLGVRAGPRLGVVVIKSPFQTEFKFCRVPRMGGIKLRPLCGVRIKLAVGYLPYPKVLDLRFQTGTSLGFTQEGCKKD